MPLLMTLKVLDANLLFWPLARASIWTGGMGKEL